MRYITTPIMSHLVGIPDELDCNESVEKDFCAGYDNAYLSVQNQEWMHSLNRQDETAKEGETSLLSMSRAYVCGYLIGLECAINDFHGWV